jgi:hypothetical protein
VDIRGATAGRGLSAAWTQIFTVGTDHLPLWQEGPTVTQPPT